MEYISVKEAASKFSLSERRIQKLCETGRIDGSERISGVWIIPSDATKPNDERLSGQTKEPDKLTLQDVCDILGISIATGRNWIKLEKLIPTEKIGRTPFFDVGYIEKLKLDIKTGKKNALKSRRNKKFVSGNSLYNSYVSKDCSGIRVVEDTLAYIADNKIELNDDLIKMIIANAAMQMLSEVFDGKKITLKKYLSEQNTESVYSLLISDLIGEIDEPLKYIHQHTQLFDMDYAFEYSEDVLGLLYISCLNSGNRKATGSYYTPTVVVKELISNLSLDSDLNRKKILDPCCGTGNFLLQLPDNISIDNVYGNDIDSMSVMITRINIALKFMPSSLDVIYRNVTISDYLTEYDRDGFDYVIGNPPWGYEFDVDQIALVDKKYKVARGAKTESYDVFTEKAIEGTCENGVIAFVLPEAILNVKSHQPIRQIIMERTSIQSLGYLGNAFDGVQCPCIILQLKHTGESFNSVGMKVWGKGNSFVIQTNRTVDSEVFSFTMTDSEYEVIQKIERVQAAQYLKNNATFALGIVTGNNKEYLSDNKTNDNEMILKGSDLLKYRFVPSSNYIKFLPETFQQIAPIEYYRAEEKLLYRFICNQLVFAYDNKQTLSLNSCNILIPNVPSLSCKYIMAILNSKVSQFYFKKMFNSVKVLRSHIEQIPLPPASKNVQMEIEHLVDSICGSKDMEYITSVYEKVDVIIAGLFQLNQEEYNMVVKSVSGENNFLI